MAAPDSTPALIALLRRRLYAVRQDKVKTRFGRFAQEMHLKKLPQELRDPALADHPRVPELLARLEALTAQVARESQQEVERAQNTQWRLLELLQLELTQLGG